MSYKTYCPVCGYGNIITDVNITNERIRIARNIVTGEFICEGLETRWDTEALYKCENCQNLLKIYIHGRKMLEKVKE